MRHFQVRHFVGVYDARMVRIYRTIGSSPEVLGSEGKGREQISVGLWAYSEAARQLVARRARIPDVLSRLWFDRAFGALNEREDKLAS